MKSQDNGIAQPTTMQAVNRLLRPTLHVEAQVDSPGTSLALRTDIEDWLRANYETIAVNHSIQGFRMSQSDIYQLLIGLN